MKKSKKTRNIFIVMVVIIISAIILGGLFQLEKNKVEEDDAFWTEMIKAISGERISENVTVEQYYENTKIILDIADSIRSYEKADNERISVGKDDVVTIKKWTLNGSEDITDQFDESDILKFKKLFEESDIFYIHDDFSDHDSIIFEMKVNAFQFFNGIIVTRDGKQPNTKFGEVDTVKEIEKNIYYFEGE